MNIYVKTLLEGGKCIKLLAEPIDTYATLKARIQYQEGIVAS